MNLWMIAGMVIGLLVIVGIAVAITGYASAETPVAGGCKTCDGKCTAENNCGSASCGAASGGSCTCGKK